MKDINYFIEKLILTDSEKKYTTDEIQYVAKYFCDLFDKLSRMYIVENNNKRELSEIEKFLFMYINVTSKVKDHDDISTSHDIIGSILTNKAVCQGYTSIMQFICDELSIPFLYKTTEGPFGAHGNFQVILKDISGVEHCLHCDSFLDAPENENDTITFNATLISANDMNNYHNHQDPSSEFLFWELAVTDTDLEDKKAALESLSIIEQFRGDDLEDAINNHYESLKEQIIHLNKFFKCEIGTLETRQDILKAYQIMKNYYSKANISIAREKLYNIIRQIYISYNISILNMNSDEAIKNAEETINEQIENTQRKHREKWVK